MKKARLEPTCGLPTSHAISSTLGAAIILVRNSPVGFHQGMTKVPAVNFNLPCDRWSPIPIGQPRAPRRMGHRQPRRETHARAAPATSAASRHLTANVKRTPPLPAANPTGKGPLTPSWTMGKPGSKVQTMKKDSLQNETPAHC